MTIVRADGVVIGDSETAARELGSLGDPSALPDVAEALARGEGVSAFADETTEHVARPFSRAGKVAGVVRLAIPSSGARDAANDRIERIVLIECGVVCAATIFLWFGASAWLSRVLQRLTASARRMARGDLDVRTRTRGTDEVAELGQALDQLASNLSLAIGELRDERDLQNAILDGMQEGVVVLDRERRVRLVNPAVRAMLHTPADAHGVPLHDLVHDVELDRLVERVARHPGRAGQRRRAHRDRGRGRPRAGRSSRRGAFSSSTLSPCPSDRLRCSSCSGTSPRCVALRRCSGDFAANVSHELRTPVASIRSAAETLRGAATRRPEAAGRFIDRLGRNADRPFQRLIEDLLELSRLDAKEFVLEPERVALVPRSSSTSSRSSKSARQTAAWTLAPRSTTPSPCGPTSARPRADHRSRTSSTTP